MSASKGGRWDDLRPRVLSALAMATIGLAAVWGGGAFFAALVIAVCGGILWECWRMGRSRLDGVFALICALVVAGGWGLLEIRLSYGMRAFFWFVMVVIASDIAGYFAGKSIGGAKFWPSISPKKTWAGTIAGWVAAGLVGLYVAVFTPFSWAAVPLSMVTAFAGQMGDIAQSAFKRRCGVKDSSQLIPGHGGLFDRFDGLLGAAVFVFVMLEGIGLAVLW